NPILEIQKEVEEEVGETILILIKMHRIVLLSCILIAGLSCSDNRFLYGDIQSVGDAWSKDEVIQFNIPELDTLQGYNVYLNLRNNHHYPYINIYLLVGLESPNSMKELATLQYRM